MRRASTAVSVLVALGAGLSLACGAGGAPRTAGTGGQPGASGGSSAAGGSGGGSGGGAGSGLGSGGISGGSSGGTASGGTTTAGTGGATGGASSGGAAGPGAGGGGGASDTGGAGMAGGGAGGGAGRAGAGGDGRGGGGAAGGGGSGADRAAAAVLNGFAVLKPCVSSFKPSGNASNAGDCCCEELAANENQHITKQFGGEPGVTYQVKLRVAGVAERYWYAGGTLDPTSQIFYTGGLPTIHSAAAPNTNLAPGQGACKIHPPETDGQYALPFTVPVEIRPSDGCYNGFNIFALTVSAPKQSYYLNQTKDFDGVDRQPHSVYKTDYTITIPIAGGAALDFYTIDGDHHQVTNNGTMTVPNVTTSQPYNGNFLELTVLDVGRAN